jgi:putative transposase
MGHVYYKIWIHLIWSTKNRHSFLTKDIRKSVFNHILENAKEKGFYVDSINGYLEHIHLLISLNPKYAVSDVANLLKGESSRLRRDNNRLYVFHGVTKRQENNF